MMDEEVYSMEFTNNGRAYVHLTGDICAKKIRNTFFVIALNENWIKGQRSILWHFKGAHFPDFFEFTGIFKNAHMAQNFTRPGKSAAVIEEDSQMQKQVSNFYSNIAEMLTERKIKHFNTVEEAEAWLDS